MASHSHSSGMRPRRAGPERDLGTWIPVGFNTPKIFLLPVFTHPVNATVWGAVLWRGGPQTPQGHSTHWHPPTGRSWRWVQALSPPPQASPTGRHMKMGDLSAGACVLVAELAAWFQFAGSAGARWEPRALQGVTPRGGSRPCSHSMGVVAAPAAVPKPRTWPGFGWDTPTLPSHRLRGSSACRAQAWRSNRGDTGGAPG